jgi:hypothetical protein
MWLIVVEAFAAIYLVGGALPIDASENLPSRFVFKVIPMALGLPLAFAVAAQLLGWPIDHRAQQYLNQAMHSALTGAEQCRQLHQSSKVRIAKTDYDPPLEGHCGQS